MLFFWAAQLHITKQDLMGFVSTSKICFWNSPCDHQICAWKEKGEMDKPEKILQSSKGLIIGNFVDEKIALLMLL